MAFEGLTSKLQKVFKTLTGRGKLGEKDIELAMREVKLALLEADVNYRVVKDFIKAVTARAMGAEVMECLTPGQQVIKIVNEELVAMIGAPNHTLKFGSSTPSVVLMAGLQGAGKTTMSGKLAGYTKKQFGKSPLLVGCDVYRPAAREQLRVLGEKLGVPVFTNDSSDAVAIAVAGIEFAKKNLHDLVIIDTAGRLHIDEGMMQEIAAISDAVAPAETLLVIDAMTGQDAVNAAKAFNDTLSLTGLILTKVDGDSRGGAALSVKAVTGCPIKFMGTGEKLSDIEPFYPDRVASRILGMGDMLTLIDKAQESFDAAKAKELEEKLRKDAFTLEDYLDQLRQLRGMGSMQDIMAMLPGMGGAKIDASAVDEKGLSSAEAIICSMTPSERRNPDILNASRRKRIARGSGTTVQEVNRLLNGFDSIKKMMKQFSGGKKMFKRGRMPFGF